MTITNERILSQTAVAVAHQSAYGSAAATSAAMMIQCMEAEVDPGYEYVDIQGTSGSHWPKDTHFKAGEKPTAKLTMPCTKKNLAFFAEHWFHGRPQSTQAGSTLTIANDGGGFVTALVLNGVRPHFNTDATWKMYVTVTDETPGAGQARVQIYSNSGRTQLIAQGDGSDGGAVTLAEQNSSGLSGTMTLGTVNATDSDIEITIVSVAQQHSKTLDRYFTMWRDSGSELERIIDCTVQRLVRRSQELGAVMLEVDLVGSTHEGALSTALTPTLTTDDRDIYLHDSVAYTSDVDSGAVVESVFGVEIELVNLVQVDVHNAQTASAIWKRGVDRAEIRVEQRFADEAKVVLAKGLADSFTSEKVVDTHDSKAATWTFDKVKTVEPQLPNLGPDGWARITHTMMAFEEAAATPATPLTLTIQGP